MGETKSSRKSSLPVSGMSCASCVGSVEKALSGVDGVSSANVNLASGKATVEYDPDFVDEEDLIGAVEDAGYGVEGRKASFGVTGMSCASCVGRVEKALGNVPGALDVSVNLATERATVEYVAGVAEIDDFQETAPIIPHRIGGARLGRTPLHTEKSKTLKLAANRQSGHPSHPARKAMRSV